MKVPLILLFSLLTISAKTDKTYEQLKILLDILGYIESDYVRETDREKLIYSAARGLLKPLDPYSQFLIPRAYKEMQIGTKGEYGGLGIRITIRDGLPTVVTPLPGTPAYKLGILPGDKIIKIEGEPTHELTMDEIVKKLRGKPGTSVKITILRKDEKEPFDLTITRALIKLEVLRSKMLEDNIGYIHLLEFNERAVDEMKKALNDLKRKEMKGLILDLRNNPGGLLNVAVDILKLFIGDKKLLVYTEGRTPRSKRKYYANKSAPFSDCPMVVLINKGSASGSEIVAGALQDYKRALIIGSETFGKASVQSIFLLENKHALKLTTAWYYTPSGRCIERDRKTGKGGITPDIKVEIPPELELKLREQEEIFYPGKEKKEEIKDPLIERAKEFLKAREIFFPKK